MAFLKDFRRAKAEVTAALKEWKATHPRKQGESLAAYRKRAKADLERQFSSDYAGADWSQWQQIIMEFLKILLPLFIVALLLAVLFGCVGSAQAMQIADQSPAPWTLDDATLVSCASGQCHAARPVASAARGTARLGARVTTAPIRALRAARPIRRTAAAIRAARPIRRVGAACLRAATFGRRPRH